MKNNLFFIRTHKEFEPINESNQVNRLLVEEYKQREILRGTIS
jgi:hypothetical protein